MALIFLQILTLAISEKVIEYRLSKNFGETFHDYSGNFRDGINGNKKGYDDQDTLPSDRGAYFSDSKSMIIIPETDLNNKKIEFSAPYSIVIWTNLLNYGDNDNSNGISSSVINRRGSDGNEIKLSINTDLSLNVEVVQVQENYTESESSSNSQSGLNSNRSGSLDSSSSVSSSSISSVSSSSSSLESSSSSSSVSSSSSSLESSSSSSSESSSSSSLDSSSSSSLDSSSSNSSVSSSSESSSSSSLESSSSSSLESSSSSISESSSSSSSESSSSESSSSNSSESSSSSSSESSSSSSSSSSESSSSESSGSSSSESSSSSSSESSSSSSSESSSSESSSPEPSERVLNNLRLLESRESYDSSEYHQYPTLLYSLSIDQYYFDSSEISINISDSDQDYASSYSSANQIRKILKFNRKLSDTGLKYSTWTLIRLAIENNSIQVFINEVSQGTQTIDSYSEVNQNYLTYIGGSPNAANSINGFVWSLAIDNSFLKSDYIPETSLDCEFAYYESNEYKCFPTELELSKNLNGQYCPSSCSSCDSYLRCLDCKCQVSSCEIQESSILCICPADSTATETTCECDSNQYFSGVQCEDCQISNCLECSNSNTCTKCESSFIVNNGKCECPIGEYKTQGKCEKCIENCDTCSRSDKCKACSSGFYLDTKGKCQQCGENCEICTEDQCSQCKSSFELKPGSISDCGCPVGYKDYGKCIVKRFSADSFVSKNNVVTVSFNETLNQHLNYSDFNIVVTDVKSPSIKFSVISSDKYQFEVSSEYDIQKGSVFNASLKDVNLYSTDFSFYHATDLAVELFETPATNPAAETLKNSIKSAVVSVFSVTALTAFLVNPSFFWILINTLQIITYLPLSSTPYPRALREFFINSNYLNIFPHFTKIMKIDVGEVSPYLEARQYEIENALFLVNIEAIVVQFIFNIVFVLILMILERYSIGRVKELCTKWLKNYQYGYFLKLLTGIYMDFLVFSLVQLRTTSSDVVGVLNAASALFMLTILILSPCATLIFSYRAMPKIVDLNNQDFHQKWGSLFDEFKNTKGFLSTQFYALFMTRRLFYGLGQVFLNSHLIFLSTINILGTFFVLCFNIKFLPYKDKGVNICCLLEEGAILMTMVLSLVFFSDAGLGVKKTVEVCIMVVVFASILLQVVICVVMMVVEVKGKVASKKKNVVVPVDLRNSKELGLDTTAVVYMKSGNYENEDTFSKV